MLNSYFSESHYVTFNRERVKKEMRETNRKSQSKRGLYNLQDLARDLNLDYGYLRKEIWKKGLLREHAVKMAALFEVRLEYLEGKSGIRTEKDLEDLERESAEQDKRAENRFLSYGLEYFKLLPNINIVFVENIDNEYVTDTGNKPNIGYKITYRDKNYNESPPIYKTVSEMKDFIKNMNEIIEQIIVLHLSK